MCALRQIVLFIALNTLSTENVNIIKNRITKKLFMADLRFYAEMELIMSHDIALLCNDIFIFFHSILWKSLNKIFAWHSTDTPWMKQDLIV